MLKKKPTIDLYPYKVFLLLEQARSVTERNAWNFQDTFETCKR